MSIIPIKPVALEYVVEAAESICNKSKLYSDYGMKPPHLVIPLDAGDGRSTVIRYIKSMFKKHRILNFDSGIDEYVDVILDGSLRQLRKAFSEIDAAAVYANYFTGIIAMDITALSTHLNESQCREFIENVQVYGKHGFFVFFIRTNPSVAEKRLVAKLTDTVPNIKELEIDPYSTNEICDIVLGNIKKRNISVTDEEEFKEDLSELLNENAEIKFLKISEITQMVLSCADINDGRVVLDRDGVAMFIRNMKKAEGK